MLIKYFMRNYFLYKLIYHSEIIVVFSNVGEVIKTFEQTTDKKHNLTLFQHSWSHFLGCLWPFIYETIKLWWYAESLLFRNVIKITHFPHISCFLGMPGTPLSSNCAEFEHDWPWQLRQICYFIMPIFVFWSG